MSIQDIILKIKGLTRKSVHEQLMIHIKWVVCVISVLMLCTLSFLLGKITKIDSEIGERPISVIYPPLVSSTEKDCSVTQQTTTKKIQVNLSKDILNKDTSNFIASKSGKVYYTKNCKGINRIKVENRVYFSTQVEAEKKGLTLSKTCTPS